MVSPTTSQQPSKLRLFYQQESIMKNDPFPLFQRDSPEHIKSNCRACKPSQSQSCSYQSSILFKGSDDVLHSHESPAKHYLATTKLKLFHRQQQAELQREPIERESTSSEQQERNFQSKVTNQEGLCRPSKIAKLFERDEYSSSSFNNDDEIYGQDYQIESPTPTMTNLKKQLDQGIKGMKIKQQKSGDSNTVSILSQGKKLNKKKMNEVLNDSSENDFMSSISTDDDEDLF